MIAVASCSVSGEMISSPSAVALALIVLLSTGEELPGAVTLYATITSVLALIPLESEAACCAAVAAVVAAVRALSPATRAPSASDSCWPWRWPL